MESRQASVMLVMPSPGNDDGGPARMIRPGVAVFADIKAETRADREDDVSNVDFAMRRDARARLMPTFYKATLQLTVPLETFFLKNAHRHMRTHKGLKERTPTRKLYND